MLDIGSAYDGMTLTHIIWIRIGGVLTGSFEKLFFHRELSKHLVTFNMFHLLTRISLSLPLSSSIIYSRDY